MGLISILGSTDISQMPLDFLRVLLIESKFSPPLFDEYNDSAQTSYFTTLAHVIVPSSRPEIVSIFGEVIVYS